MLLLSTGVPQAQIKITTFNGGIGDRMLAITINRKKCLNGKILNKKMPPKTKGRGRTGDRQTMGAKLTLSLGIRQEEEM